MENSSETSPEEDWSPDQRHAYELECRRETREQLTRVLSSSGNSARSGTFA